MFPSHSHLFHFFISFAFLLLSICLFFLSSKNFKNMLKVLFFVYHMFHIAFPVWVYFINLIWGLQNFLNLWLNIFCQFGKILCHSLSNIVLSHSHFLLHSVIPHSNILELSTMIHFSPLSFPSFPPHPLPPLSGHFWLTHLPVHWLSLHFNLLLCSFSNS